MKGSPLVVAYVANSYNVLHSNIISLLFLLVCVENMSLEPCSEGPLATSV